MPEIQREPRGSAVCLRVEGAYDEETFGELRRRLDEESAPQVLLDFGGTIFQDARLAMLVVVLVTRLCSHPECTIRVNGLRQHQERILGHLGVELDSSGKVLVRPA